MHQNRFQRMFSSVLLSMILLIASFTGCTTTVSEKRGETATQAATTEPTKTEEAVTTPTPSSSKYLSKYYYFDDVLVPGELKYKQNKSFVYETPRFKAGILAFSAWRVNVDSLIDFFTYNMEKDHWKVVNSFRGKESILNFSKPDRACTIKVTDKWYGKTAVEIRVGPMGERKM